VLWCRGVDDHDVAAGRCPHRRHPLARYPCRACAAREVAWAAGAAPGAREWLHLDVDSTITIDHSDNKESAAATWKKTFGHHPLLVFLDRLAAGVSVITSCASAVSE
jgi:hypothetical protein